MCGLYLSDIDDAVPHPADLDGASSGALLQHLEGIARRHGVELDAAHGRLLDR